jgi:aspartyl-tRNA(Asn)/glutamyl-tRNA(Gln) amidotransferase subunit B
MKLHQILQYLGVSTANMEEGAFRVDANVSIRPVGSTEFGSKVEVKNMNSFRAVERAMAYEVERQAEVLASGGRIVQETRGWVEERGVTVSQRSKEFAHDYRYFPEPDLPPLVIKEEWVKDVTARLPELPDAKRQRFVSQYGLSEYDATVLTNSRDVADYFEQAAGDCGNAKLAANWITGELFRLLKTEGMNIRSSQISPSDLAGLLQLIDKQTISGRQAKEVLEEMFATGRPADSIVSEKGLTQVSDRSSLEASVDAVLAANPQAVDDYRAGKTQASGFLVGQVMKVTKGKANPAIVNEILRDKLS